MSSIDHEDTKSSDIMYWTDEMQQSEPLLQHNPQRYVMFPLQYPDLWKLYKKHVASFWTAEGSDLSQDLIDFRTKLNDGERGFIKSMVAFSGGFDGIIIENLAVRVLVEVQAPEARAFYGFQLAMENIHSECYSLMIDTYITDPKEKQDAFEAINKWPILKKMKEWGLKWAHAKIPFPQFLVGQAIVEGVFFSGLFCSVFWLKKRNLMPGLTFFNEEIAPDEGLHCDWACHLLKHHIVNRPPEALVVKMMKAGTALAIEFVTITLPVELIGMNSKLMGEYIQFVSDRLMVAMGYSKIYNAKNPFGWMEMISLPGKTNFFDKRVGEYQKAGILASKKDQEFSSTSDF